MGHERDLLETVTELRSQSMHSTDFSQKQQAESALSGGLVRLFAVVSGALSNKYLLPLTRIFHRVIKFSVGN